MTAAMHTNSISPNAMLNLQALPDLALLQSQLDQKLFFFG